MKRLARPATFTPALIQKAEEHAAIPTKHRVRKNVKNFSTSIWKPNRNMSDGLFNNGDDLPIMKYVIAEKMHNGSILIGIISQRTLAIK